MGEEERRARAERKTKIWKKFEETQAAAALIKLLSDICLYVCVYVCVSLANGGDESLP